MKTRVGMGSTLVLAILLATAGPVGSVSAAGPDPKEYQAVLDKAVNFLKKQQLEDGSFSPKMAGPGVSALVVAGLLRNGHSPNEPLLARTLAYMESRVQKDGGIYDKQLANYATSVALMAFREANTNGKYDTLIQKATQFLKSLQGWKRGQRELFRNNSRWPRFYRFRGRMLAHAEEDAAQIDQPFPVEVQLFHRGPAGRGQAQDVRASPVPGKVIPPVLRARVEQEDPTPADAKVSVPGFAFAAATRSATVLNPLAADATSTFG